MVAKITTAVFPVAGLGTRFLPITKAGPKEMLPIVDKPLIQYVVEEAVAAGITQLVFVTSSCKRAIEDYFDSHYEFEARLFAEGKLKDLQMIKNIVPEHVNVAYVRQPHPLGLGDAVLRAQSVVGDSPFAVLLADDIIDCGKQGCLQKMCEVFERTQASVLAVEKVPPSKTDQYGIVSLKNQEHDVYPIAGIIEKPKPEYAPSNYGVVGRYILSPRIFHWLANTPKGMGGELQLTDAIASLLAEEAVVAYPFSGKRFDCGGKIGFIEATVTYALRRPDIGPQLRSILNELLEDSTMQVLLDEV